MGIASDSAKSQRFAAKNLRIVRIFSGMQDETARIVMDPSSGSYGCVVPAGTWHTVEVLEPSVIYEAKDGKYGEDGSESV